MKIWPIEWFKDTYETFFAIGNIPRREEHESLSRLALNTVITVPMLFLGSPVYLAIRLVQDSFNGKLLPKINRIASDIREKYSDRSWLMLFSDIMSFAPLYVPYIVVSIIKPSLQLYGLPVLAWLTIFVSMPIATSFARVKYQMREDNMITYASTNPVKFRNKIGDNPSPDVRNAEKARSAAKLLMQYPLDHLSTEKVMLASEADIEMDEMPLVGAATTNTPRWLDQKNRMLDILEDAYRIGQTNPAPNRNSTTHTIEGQFKKEMAKMSKMHPRNDATVLNQWRGILANASTAREDEEGDRFRVHNAAGQARYPLR